MPIYEYRCRLCRKRFQILTLRASERVEPCCEHCSSREADRLPSRFALARPEESRWDSLAGGDALAGLEGDDPRSVARWMRRMGNELGEDLDRSQLDEMVDEIESGAAAGGKDAGSDTGDDSGGNTSSED